MNPVILIGIRYGQPERDRNWRFNRARWEQLGWPIHEGIHEGPEPFSMSRASNLAAAQASAATDWDVALYAGADFTVGRLTQAHAAVEGALRTGRLTLAHTHLTLLDEDETAALALTDPAGDQIHLTPAGVRHPNTFSGVLAIPRRLWDEVGGFDERLIGWGWDDLAFWAACGALAGGYDRLSGDIYHLWHPRSHEENEGNPHHAANQVLGERYLRVKQNREAMLALLSEPGGPRG